MLRGPSRPMEEVTEDKAFRCYTAPGETFATEAEMKVLLERGDQEKAKMVAQLRQLSQSILDQ